MPSKPKLFQTCTSIHCPERTGGKCTASFDKIHPKEMIEYAENEIKEWQKFIKKCKKQ